MERSVPRYFFNTADGTRDCDELGIELPNNAAARVEAIRYAGALLADQPEVLWDGRDFRVEVVTEDEQLVCTVITLAVNMPALC